MGIAGGKRETDQAGPQVSHTRGWHCTMGHAGEEFSWADSSEIGPRRWNFFILFFFSFLFSSLNLKFKFEFKLRHELVLICKCTLWSCHYGFNLFIYKFTLYFIAFLSPFFSFPIFILLIFKSKFLLWVSPGIKIYQIPC
jgi:hypothetical protein